MTTPLSFSSREVAEEFLPRVQATVPAAEVSLVNESDCSHCGEIFAATEGVHGCEAHYPPTPRSPEE